MKFSKPQKIKELASLIGAEITGNSDLLIYGINELNVIMDGDIAFVDHPKYYDKTLKSKAAAIIINKKVECPAGKALLVTDDPFSAFNRISSQFSSRSFSQKAISDSAVIGKNTRVMPNCFVGDNVKIGDNCTIHPNVSIYDNCIIGNNVILHSGVVIGADAFYYKKRPAGYDRLLSCGKVVIEDNVEIGALSSIDRGVTGETIIGNGTKIDNHVQVGHDTKVGKNCLFASMVGISGACVIEDDVVLWGQVGVPSKIRIGKGAVLLGQSAPAKDVEGGKTYLGSPCDESMKKFRELAMLRKLPEIFVKMEK
ncbi:MAG: UDP-3-O-(3-hydroxymyristoyl)glucosamine N-acyltransferase [Bacteroidetes bacterium]|nr:UDP-3-O-(3-hydroxymyristoyl)glucosamine N-acyltransferase [Bacteroidota bacterium]